MDLYNEFRVRVNPAERLDVQLAEIADMATEEAYQAGYTQACVIVVDRPGRRIKHVYVYVREEEE